MARSLSNAARQSLFSIDGNGEVWLVLLKMGNTYVVNNNEDIVSRGQTYTAYPFDIFLPADSLEKSPTVTLRIDNVDQSLTQWIREQSSPPEVTLEIVLASNPDAIEIKVDNLLLVDVSWTATTITGTLRLEDIFNMEFPSKGSVYDPNQFPGLHS